MSENDQAKRVTDVIAEIGQELEKALAHEESISESVWNSLSSEDQLWVFCAVMRRLYRASIVEGRSYRGTLYDVFGWGPESYTPAQASGFLDIHNTIHTPDELAKITEFVVKELGYEADPERIREIIFKRLYY